MADDWRVRVELADEAARERFTQFLTEGLSPQGADQAQALQGDHLSVSGDDANLFVYADSANAGREGALGDPLGARAPRDRCDDEWRRALARSRGAVGQRACRRDAGRKRSTTLGYAPWEVRATCGSRHEAIELATQLEAEGYRPIRRWKHLIVGADTRADADALATRLHGDVEAGGAVVWEEAIDSDVVRPFCLLRLRRCRTGDQCLTTSIHSSSIS